jgi:hypothetical protein
MAYNNRNEANNGFVYNVNNVNNLNNVNSVNNMTTNVNNVNNVNNMLNSLPQPLLLQASQVYERHRAVRRPHWQQQHTIPPYTQQHQSSYPYQQPLYPQLQSLPPQSQLQPMQQIPPAQLEQASTPSYYPHPDTPQTSTYSPQLDEINFEDEEQEHSNKVESSHDAKKKKRRGLRRRKVKDDPSM